MEKKYELIKSDKPRIRESCEVCRINTKRAMMIEVSEEAIVFCHKLACDAWIDSEVCCKDCPIDILFKTKQAFCK